MQICVLLWWLHAAKKDKRCKRRPLGSRNKLLDVGAIMRRHPCCWNQNPL